MPYAVKHDPVPDITEVTFTDCEHGIGAAHVATLSRWAILTVDSRLLGDRFETSI